jgi:FkbM family methyltransferase
MTFTSSPFWRIVYRPFKPLVRLARRLAQPGVPNDHKITRVFYRQRQFSIEHRRWSDQIIIDECFREMQYDLPTGAQGHLAEHLYRGIVGSGKKPLIVDCGANIGVSVLWFSARYPEAHIVAIEPAPDNFALLRRNCLDLDVDLRNVGIGAVDGTANLSTASGTGYGYRTNLSGDGLPTKILSLGTILASKPASCYTPFLLKVDIEGAEKYLFSSDYAVLNRFPVILMEPHDRFFPGEGTSLEFFRFHADTRREFSMNSTTIASLALHPLPSAPGTSHIRDQSCGVQCVAENLGSTG